MEPARWEWARAPAADSVIVRPEAVRLPLEAQLDFTVSAGEDIPAAAAVVSLMEAVADGAGEASVRPLIRQLTLPLPDIRTGIPREMRPLF